MDIAINCRCFLKKNNTGIGRYALNLIKSLGAIDQENHYTLYVRRGPATHNQDISYLRLKNIRVKNDWFHLGPSKVLKGMDLYHSPCPENLPFDRETKMIVTVHDLIFKTYPQGHTEEAIRESERQFQDIIEKAGKIICCSKSTLNDLQKYFPVEKQKLTLVYQGVDKNIFYMIGDEEERLADHFLKERAIDDPFILSVGTIEPRKNLRNIFHAFHRLKVQKKFSGRLVVAGMKGWLNEGIEGILGELELKDQVVFLGFLSDQELRYCYNKAQAVVFPSFYEGFGFPIVEAFCCGSPVVTSNVSSCPEIAQDAALLVDPHNPEEISSAVERILHDPALRQSLREKGLRRSGDFNFRKTAQNTLAVYEEVYKNG